MEQIIIKAMSQSQQVDGTLFDFGTIAQTQIMKVEDELCLPYNPFTFDISLRIIKSIQPYESNVSFNISSGSKSIFGRKKTEVEHILKAPTVSSKHFVIDEGKKIYDLGSTKGTFMWVQRERAAEIQIGKHFLIGKSEISLESITFHDRRVRLKIDGKPLELNKKQNPILIGCHNRCEIKIDGKQYYAAIDLINMRLYSFLENEDYDCDLGVWERLSPRKEQSLGRQLEPEDIILVYPYILRVEY